MKGPRNIKQSRTLKSVLPRADFGERVHRKVELCFETDSESQVEKAFWEAVIMHIQSKRTEIV